VEEPEDALCCRHGRPVQESPGCGSRKPRRAMDAVVGSELELSRAR
jgi:hypothetical protein